MGKIKMLTSNKFNSKYIELSKFANCIIWEHQSWKFGGETVQLYLKHRMHKILFCAHLNTKIIQDHFQLENNF